MSKHAAQVALQSLIGRPAYLEASYAGQPVEGLDTGGASMLADLRLLSTADLSVETAGWGRRKAEVLAAYGLTSDGSTEKPFAYANGVAVIAVHGVLINRFQYSFGYVSGYNFIRSQMNAALADLDVKLIVFDVNSYGGMVAGCDELAADIYESRKVKPSVAMVDAACYSAAYFIASSASRVIITPTSGVGSIGCLAIRMDVTAALDEAGLKFNVIYRGENKLDSLPLVPLSDSAKARIQASVDYSYSQFVSGVARNRKMSIDDVTATEASTYDPPEALALGLIDAVLPPAAALEATLNDPPPLATDDDDEEDDEPDPDDIDPLTGEPYMATVQTTTATAQTEAAAAARDAERQRIAAITTHAEADGRTGLAQHLAFNTSTSADDAAKVMAASPKQAPPAPPAAVATAAVADVSALDLAMGMVAQPNVRPGAEIAAPAGGTTVGSVAETPATRAKGILAAQHRLTGTDPTKH